MLETVGISIVTNRTVVIEYNHASRRKFMYRRLLTSYPQRLQEMRTAVAKAAPKAEEKISYGMPTRYSLGSVVHYARCKSHIGFYPGPNAIRHFQAELSD